MDLGRQDLNDFHGLTLIVELDGDAVSDRQVYKQIRSGETKEDSLVEIRGEDTLTRLNVQHAESA